MSDIQNKLKRIEQLQQELKELIRKEATPIVKDLLQEFFESHLGVDQIRWQQYTPYFNDGEPCEFRVYDPTVYCSNIEFLRENLSKDAQTHTEYVQQKKPDSHYTHYVKSGERPCTDEELLHGGETGDGYYSWYEFKGSKLEKDLRNISSILCNQEDLLLQAFGDHVQVTASRDSIEVDEVEHE